MPPTTVPAHAHRRPRAGRVACVLEVDPNLGAGLPAAHRHAAAQALVADVRVLPRGPWTVREVIGGRSSFGLLIVEGLAVGTTDLGGRRQGEILGAGDLLRPWVHLDDEAIVEHSLNWRILSPMCVLVLDRRFAAVAGRWPEVTATLMDRLMLRVRRLSFQMAANALPRAADRLLLMLWLYAERWGVVTRAGVLLELPVTHGVLASIIGTHRPSVTNALGELRARGQVLPRPPSRWLLPLPPPEGLRALRDQAGLP